MARTAAKGGLLPLEKPMLRRTQTSLKSLYTEYFSEMAMAARTWKIFHDEDTRKRIKAAAIIDRLQAFVLGNNPDAMSRTQVTAAMGLLDKVLPALKSVTIMPEKTTTFVFRCPEKSESTEAWLRDYAPKHIAEQQLGLIGPTKA